MGVYIKNWSLADWKELLTWAKIGANNAMIGEFSEVEEVPPHGRLIDADALMSKDRQIYRGDGAAIGARRYIEFSEIEDAPTIIPAEEGE